MECDPGVSASNRDQSDRSKARYTQYFANSHVRPVIHLRFCTVICPLAIVFISALTVLNALLIGFTY